MDSIGLNDAMRYIWMGNEFSMVVVAADRKRDKGGNLIKYAGVKLTPQFDRKKKVITMESVSKNPNHFTNDTRNIILPNGNTESFHPRLMIEFNGREVVY